MSYPTSVDDRMIDLIRKVRIMDNKIINLIRKVRIDDKMIDLIIKVRINHIFYKIHLLNLQKILFE